MSNQSARIVAMAQPKAKTASRAQAPGGPPAAEPIGRVLDSTAKLLSRTFHQKLAEAGGSRPGWLILLALNQQRHRTHHDLSGASGIEGPWLTLHLYATEKT